MLVRGEELGVVGKPSSFGKLVQSSQPSPKHEPVLSVACSSKAVNGERRLGKNARGQAAAEELARSWNALTA